MSLQQVITNIAENKTKFCKTKENKVSWLGWHFWKFIYLLILSLKTKLKQKIQFSYFNLLKK
jgi:hypothetical protein